MSRTCFKVTPHSTDAGMSRNSLLEKGAIFEVKMTATGLELITTKFVNEHSTIYQNWPNN